ncbi:MAG: DUF4381 domain-containing protein [Alphaproteobacteria bacterium]
MIENYPIDIPDNMDKKIFDSLIQLKDIHFSDDASFFPLAPIWYLPVLVLFILIFMWLWRNFFCYQGRLGRAKRIALQRLEKLFEKHQYDEEIAPFASEISILLKRVAIVAFGKGEVALLYEKKWGDFILSRSKVKNLDKNIVLLISCAGYLKPKKDDKTKDCINNINVFVKEWIRLL